MGETEGVTRRPDRGITDVKKYAPQWGWARVTGGGGSHASNLPIFFMVLEYVSRSVSHDGLPLVGRRLTDGVPRRLAQW